MLINLNTYIFDLHKGLWKKWYTANVMKHQTTTWANVYPDICHHVASLGRNEFPVTSYIFMLLPTLTGMW